MVSIREIQELRGNVANWDDANRIWRLLAEPVYRMSSYADSDETWIRCNQWGAWRCLWSGIHFARELTTGRELDWECLFMGHLEEFIPIRKRLSGTAQFLHIHWATGDEQCLYSPQTSGVIAHFLRTCR